MRSGKLQWGQTRSNSMRVNPFYQIHRNRLGPNVLLERNVFDTRSEATIANKTFGVTRNSRLKQSNSARLKI